MNLNAEFKNIRMQIFYSQLLVDAFHSSTFAEFAAQKNALK